MVFDVDGTLCKTNSVDADCLTRAFAETLGIPAPASDWSQYKESTDSGILQELCRTHLKRDPTMEEAAACPARFLELLDLSHSENPGRFRAVPGAPEMMNDLKKDPAWRPAIATGGFRVTALFKLRAAGINIQGVPFATANDSTSRRGIIQTAVNRAKSGYSAGEFSRIVYVGDGEWDLRAAHELGIGFVCVLHDIHKTSPRPGAERTLKDFLDYRAFINALSPTS